MLRRLRRIRELFTAPTVRLSMPIWREDGEWPYLVYFLGEGHLAVYLASQWDELDWTVAILGALDGLNSIHLKGVSLGVDLEYGLLVGNGRARLLLVDPFPAAFQPGRDIESLARWVSGYGPWHPESVPALVEEWSESPPPNTKDALSLARRCMAERLGDYALDLRKKGEELHHQLQGGRLLSAIEKLQLPPPLLKVQLASGKRVYTEEDVLYLECPREGKRLVFSTSEGLVVENGRLLRTECLRSITELSNESDRSALKVLRRWLQSSIQLRRLNALLRYQLRQLYSIG